MSSRFLLRTTTLSVVIVLLATIMTIAGPTRPAAASPMFTSSLLMPHLAAADGGPWVTVLRLPPITLKANQSVFLRGRIAANSNAPRGPMIGSRIVCLATGGGGGSTYSTRNHDGKAFGVQSTTNRWLFTSNRDATYNCELRGRAATYLSPERVRLLLAPDKTYLRARIAKPGSVEWRPARDTCVGSRAIKEIAHCAKPKRSVIVLRKVVNVGDARSVNVMGDLELTREYGMYPGGDSVVRTTLAARPLNLAGLPCGVNRSGTQRHKISSGLHHLKVHHTQSNVAVNQSALCGKKLRVRMRVELVSGNPVTIHDGVYSNAIVLRR